MVSLGRRAFRPGADSLDLWFVGAVLTLMALGTMAVFGAGSFHPSAPGMHYYLLRHLERMALGVLICVGLALFDHVRLRRGWLVYVALVVGLLFTAQPVVMRDVTIDRWVAIPGLGQFQPIEVAKLALVMFLAYRLSRSPLDTPLSGRPLAITVLAGPVALIILLILQPNFGNVVVLSLVSVLMFAVAGMSWRWLAGLIPLGLAASLLGYLLVTKLHTRIDRWLGGWRGVSLDSEPPFGYQVNQSLMGMGAGGWRGLGPGASHNKFAFLPEAHTDFAVSHLGEELGLIGSLLVVTALVVLVWRAMIIARRATNGFGRLLAAGLGGMIFIYGAANIAMVTGVIPVMGVPLPFISYGGSALVTNLAAVGLIINVDRQSRGRRRR